MAPWIHGHDEHGRRHCGAAYTDMDPDTGAQMARAEGTEGEGSLMTKPDFGCIQFAPKDAA